MYVALGSISVTGLFALTPKVLDVGEYDGAFIIPFFSLGLLAPRSYCNHS